MGARKAVGVIFLLLLLIVAALYASPELRERVRQEISNKINNINNNEASNSTPTGAGGETSTAPTEAGSSPTSGGGSTGSVGETTTPGSLPTTTTNTETGESSEQRGGLSLEASASNIYYDETMEHMTVTLNVTNTGSDPVTVEEIRVAGYSTNNILGSTPALPLTIGPGETVSINVTTTVNLATIDIYADYPIVLVTPQGNVTITAKSVRAPGWLSGYWEDDFLTMLTDSVFLEIGIPVPYDHILVISTNQTQYGIATTYKKIYNITSNIFEEIDGSQLLAAIEDFLQNNNLSNLTIDNTYINETYLHISASLAENGSYKHAEVIVAYDQDADITQIILATTVA